MPYPSADRNLRHVAPTELENGGWNGCYPHTAPNGAGGSAKNKTITAVLLPPCYFDAHRGVLSPLNDKRASILLSKE